jgi:uncharacterized membrane protein
MVLMAIDHASYFIARAHAFEAWSHVPPYYASAAAFITRWITHLCAPGFVMLMGAGMVWLGKARQRDGWSHARIRKYFITRGLMLLVIQHLVENLAWALGSSSMSSTMPLLIQPPGGGSDFIFHFGVISALGVAMIVWAFLIELPSIVVAAIMAVAMAASVVFTPPPAQASVLFPVWKLFLFVPSHANLVNVLYPFVPWLVPAGVGILLGRIVAKKPGKTVPLALAGGAAAIAAFVVMRAMGVGDPHQALPGFIAFMSVTKYPPSPAFLAVTLGVDLLLLAAFWITKEQKVLRPLEVFGQVPLFFYLLHLYVFAAASFMFPTGTSFGVMYAVWAAGIVAMYPLCKRYAAFKHAKPADSLWRMW